MLPGSGDVQMDFHDYAWFSILFITSCRATAPRPPHSSTGSDTPNQLLPTRPAEANSYAVGLGGSKRSISDPLFIRRDVSGYSTFLFGLILMRSDPESLILFFDLKKGCLL